MDGDDLHDKTTGRVVFDDRGNAVWEWATAKGASVRKLDETGLSIAADAPISPEKVRANPLGAKKGYDPYDSGKLGKARASRKKDLRKLSEWVKLKKQFEENKKILDESED